MRERGMDLVAIQQMLGEWSVDSQYASSARRPCSSEDAHLCDVGRLWVAQLFANTVTWLRPSPDRTSAVIEELITSDLFQTSLSHVVVRARHAVIASVILIR
jgi:hypothetical protein